MSKKAINDYIVRCKDKTGKTFTKVITANSEKQIKKLLKKKGETLISANVY